MHVNFSTLPFRSRATLSRMGQLVVRFEGAIKSRGYEMGGLKSSRALSLHHEIHDSICEK
jgi:hypothetical protein